MFDTRCAQITEAGVNIANVQERRGDAHSPVCSRERERLYSETMSIPGVPGRRQSQGYGVRPPDLVSAADVTTTVLTDQSFFGTSYGLPGICRNGVEPAGGGRRNRLGGTARRSKTHRSLAYQAHQSR